MTLCQCWASQRRHSLKRATVIQEDTAFNAAQLPKKTQPLARHSQPKKLGTDSQYQPNLNNQERS